MKKDFLINENGSYGVKVGRKTVFTKEGAVERYKMFLGHIYGEGLDPAGALVLSEVEDDLISIGFTWEELEEIETDFLKKLA